MCTSRQEGAWAIECGNRSEKQQNREMGGWGSPWLKMGAMMCAAGSRVGQDGMWHGQTCAFVGAGRVLWSPCMLTNFRFHPVFPCQSPRRQHTSCVRLPPYPATRLLHTVTPPPRFNRRWFPPTRSAHASGTMGGVLSFGKRSERVERGGGFVVQRKLRNAPPVMKGYPSLTVWDRARSGSVERQHYHQCV